MKKGTRICQLSLALILMIALVFTSGCGEANSVSPVASSTSAEPAVSKTADENTPASESVVSEPTTPAAADPFEKYTPEITAKVVNVVDNTVKFPEGDSSDNNVWTRAYRDVLGIKTEMLWTIDVSQFEQKMNVTIASGDLPDIFPVNVKQFKMLVEADAVADLTDGFTTYVSPLTQEIISKGQTFKLGYSGDRLLGLTYGNAPMDNASMLFIREDWRKKLNLPEPKTMNDFYAIAEAFVTKDPDGNGVADTYALALTQGLVRGDGGNGIAGISGLMGLSNAYGAYPVTWIKDTNGQNVYGSIQPAMRTVLEKVQEMYTKGWIDQEFAVKDSIKVNETITSGKVGMEFGLMWNPFYPLVSTVQNDANADWQSYPLPILDNVVNKVSTSVSANYIWVVRKGYEHPEAAVKMVNLFTGKFWGETSDNSMTNGDGVEIVPFKYALAQVWPETKNYEGHLACVDALKTGDTSKLNAEEQNYFNTMKPFVDSGDMAGWGTWKIFGENSTFDVIGNYLTTDRYLYDEFHGVPTATMTEKGSTLDKMENEAFTKIVMGAPIEEFDTFVSNWKRLGGDDITAEMNR